MLVIPPKNENTAPPVPLAIVKPGRTVALVGPSGRIAYYLVPRVTSVEANVQPAAGKCMLVNLETGRVVMKASNLLVAVLSCTATTTHRP